MIPRLEDTADFVPGDLFRALFFLRLGGKGIQNPENILSAGHALLVGISQTHTAILRQIIVRYVPQAAADFTPQWCISKSNAKYVKIEEYGGDWTYHSFREALWWNVETVLDPATGKPVPNKDNDRFRALVDGFRRPGTAAKE